MDSKLKQYCKFCKAPKIVYPKSADDKIRRTTECSLLTEAGSLLKIREVRNSIDEEAFWKRRACQCGAPIVETIAAKGPKNKLLKTVREDKDKKPNCGLEVQKFRIKWFHQFTCKQLLLLDHLVWDLIDDNDEGTLNRVWEVLFHLGLFPQPTLKQIKKAMIFNVTNPVLFLNTLLQILKNSTEKEDGKYFHNERVLMSAIVYLEMPYLLMTLLPRLAQRQQDLSEEIEEKAFVKSENKNPYLQPLRPQFNWQDKRKKQLALRYQSGKLKRRITYPNEPYKNFEFFTHIDTDIPDPDLGIVPDITISKRKVLEKDECKVDKMCREMMRQRPNLPPPSRSSQAIKKHIEEFLKTKDFDTALDITLSELTGRGMISASYHHLKYHPILINLDKFIKGELITRPLNLSIVDHAKRMKYCVKQLYERSRPDNVDKKLPDTTWAFIKTVRESGKEQRRKLFEQIWRQRVQFAQLLWRTLAPEYPQVRSFLPVFSAYITSFKTSTNFWTYLPKEF